MPKTPKKPKVITKKVFDSWSPAKQEAALADRRVRQRIETKALPKVWQEQRAQAQYNRTPITEGSSTTYGDLLKQRAMQEKSTFAEGDRQLADRYQNLSDARTRDANWFTDYRNQVAAAQDKAIQAQKDTVTGNQSLIDSANQVSASSRDAIQAQLRDRAKQLGQADQAAEYGQLADQAAASRAALLGIGAQKQVNDANTQVNMRTDAITTAGLKDLEAQGFRDRQRGALEKDTKDYVDKRATWREKFISDAITEARKQVLEDRVFQMNAADKAADNARADAGLQNTISSGRSSRRIQRDSLRERERAARERERIAREKAAKDDKGKSPYNATNDMYRSRRQELSSAVAWVKRLRGMNFTTGQIREWFAQGGHKLKKDGKLEATIPQFGRDVTNTAMDVHVNGFISPTNLRAWKRLGYDPRKLGYPTQRPLGKWGSRGGTGTGTAR